MRVAFLQLAVDKLRAAAVERRYRHRLGAGHVADELEQTPARTAKPPANVLWRRVGDPAEIVGVEAMQVAEDQQRPLVRSEVAL